MSYLVLVDEEKHDGQNFQEEDEQEEDEELWRHKEKREELFNTPFIREEETTTGKIISICL